MYADRERVGFLIVVVRQQPIANVGDQLRTKIGERRRLLDQHDLFDARYFNVADFDHAGLVSTLNALLSGPIQSATPSVTPPSITIWAPVTCLDAADAKNNAAPCMSSGVAMRCWGENWAKKAWL